MADGNKPKRKHDDTRISAYPHSLEEVLEKALQVPPPDGTQAEQEREREDHERDQPTFGTPRQ